MFRFHLRTLIGAVSALMVALVAVITVFVATSLAFDTINANGRSAVVTQTRAAVAAADLIFSKPTEALVSLSKLPDRHSGSPYPNDTIDSVTTTAEEPDGPIAEKYLDEMLSRQKDVNFNWYWMNAFLYDGSNFVVAYVPSLLPLAARMSVVPRGSGARDLNVRVMLPSTGTPLPAPPGSDPDKVVQAVKFVLQGTLPDLRTPDVRGHFDRVVSKTTTTTPYWTMPLLAVSNGIFMMPIVALMQLRHRGQPVGIVYVDLEIRELGSLLSSARATPGSHAFAVDQQGHLVASTAEDAPYSHNFNISATHKAGAGCVTTMSTAGAAGIPVTGIPDQGMMCRDHMSTAAVMGGAVAAVAASFPSIIDEALGSDNGEPIVHDDTGYFVAAQRFPSLAENHRISDNDDAAEALRLTVLVITPRADVVGTASQIIPRSVWITACIVVVFAILAFVLVWLVLRPLQPIAERMGKAARLEDDDPPTSRSWLAEIFDLQAAFDEMAAELNRVRSFVPQSLLHADDDEDGVDEELVEGSILQPSSRQSSQRKSTARETMYSVKSSRQSGCSPRRSTVTGRLAPSSSQSVSSRMAPVARTADGVSGAAISVLSINLIGFHASILARGSHATQLQPSALDQDALGKTVSTVLAAATAQKGVVDSFHGDRFMVSFNASRAAAGHGARAAKTAAGLVSSIAAAGLQLRVTQGLATGPALVGNVGCAGLKRFAAIGSVVPRAAALERLCKLYDGATCLVPQRLFADLSTAVRLQTVDLVRLPGVAAPTLIAAVVSELDSCEAGEQDEWMYQLQQQGDDSATGADCSVAELVLEAWTAVLAHDPERADAKLLLAKGMVASSEEVSKLDSVSVRRLAHALERLGTSVPAAEESSKLQLAASDLGEFFSVAIL